MDTAAEISAVTCKFTDTVHPNRNPDPHLNDPAVIMGSFRNVRGAKCMYRLTR